MERHTYGAVAQDVERRSEVPKVEGSPLLVPPIAFLAQSAERILGMDEVIGSNPIKGSNASRVQRMYSFQVCYARQNSHHAAVA